MATFRQGSPDSWDAPSPDRFRLEGPSRRLDPRINAFRTDIADVHLAGLLFAPHYARPQRGSISQASVMLRASPDINARAISQLMLGEMFDTLDVSGGWAWGRCAHDCYVGYLPAHAVAALRPATHRVRAVIALLFAEPDIKAPVRANWPIGARFAATVEGDFLATEQGFVHSRHALRIDDTTDAMAIAESLAGLPYLWGGRGAVGIDCSGLVQIALGFAGIEAPRDSDLQRAGLGRPLDGGEGLERGDLVFFPGHVGLMVDGRRMIHANAHWMGVTIEPLADVIGRLRPAYAEPLLARRRVEMAR